MRTVKLIVAAATLVLLAGKGEYWVCGTCGTENSVHTSKCKQCGSPR